MTSRATSFTPEREPVAFELPGTLAVLQDAEHWQDRTRHYPVWQAEDWDESHPAAWHFVRAQAADLTDTFIARVQQNNRAVLILEAATEHAMPELRAACMALDAAGCDVPVILHRTYNGAGCRAFPALCGDRRWRSAPRWIRRRRLD